MSVKRKLALAGVGASGGPANPLNRLNLRIAGPVCSVAVALALALTGCTATSTDSPKTESSPQSLTDIALIQEALDNAWDMTGLPDDQRPDVEFVRYTDLIEGAEAIAACMNERGGWNVEASAGGWGSDDPMPDGQHDAYNLDSYICQAEYPTDPKYLRPLDDAQRNRLFDYYDNELRACFEEHGQTMTELPSRAKFVQDYYRMTWDAYSNVTGANTPAGARALEELRRECSMLPSVDSGVWG
jgi:hypothetical protein